MSLSHISLQHVGKRYNHEWIFRGVNHVFEQDEHTVILGANGSGKSTLLQVILQSTICSEGEISCVIDGNEIKTDECFRHFSIAAPYLELIEELTLTEMLDFHQKLKPFKSGLAIDDIIKTLYLEEAKSKAIKYYSSGMKQRVKLGLALLSETRFVLLDEPTSNLDQTAIDWYNQLVNEHKQGRVLIVCSNDQKAEFGFCTQQLNVADYKKKPSSVV